MHSLMRTSEAAMLLKHVGRNGRQLERLCLLLILLLLINISVDGAVNVGQLDSAPEQIKEHILYSSTQRALRWNGMRG